MKISSLFHWFKKKPAIARPAAKEFIAPKLQHPSRSYPPPRMAARPIATTPQPSDSSLTDLLILQALTNSSRSESPALVAAAVFESGGGGDFGGGGATSSWYSPSDNSSSSSDSSGSDSGSSSSSD